MDPRPPFLTASAVEALAARSVEHESGAAFQSLLAVASDALPRLIASVQRAQAGALSLAQRENAEHVVRDLRATRVALQAGRDTRSRCLRSEAPSLTEALQGLLRPDRQRIAEAAHALKTAAASAARHTEPPPDWFLATTDAVEALGDAAEHLHALAHQQPTGSAASEVIAEVAAVLGHSRDLLLGDIERLVD
ncbi:MAG: hypothetical protein AAF791_01990 [Bacteroidota bacterium]